MKTNVVSLNTPIVGRIRKSVLYDMDPQYEFEWLPAEAIGVLSYDKDVPTLKVLVEGAAVFDNVPLSCFVVGFQTCQSEDWPTRDLTPFLCEGHTITGSTFPRLAGAFTAFLSVDKVPVQAHYIMSLDWPDGNMAGSLAYLKGSNLLAVVPNHRALWGGCKELPPYKMLHAQRVDEGSIPSTPK